MADMFTKHVRKTSGYRDVDTFGCGKTSGRHKVRQKQKRAARAALKRRPLDF